LVWGVSYNGNLTITMGQNALSDPISDGCAELSSPLTIVRNEVDGGTVLEMGTMATSVTVCSMDGTPDVINFMNTSTSAAAYQYVVTDANGMVLGVPPGNSNDFDGAPAGTCFVYGVSYQGNFILTMGQNINTDPAADGCYSVSTAWLTIERETTEGGMVMTDAGEDSVAVTLDGMADVVTFATTSTSGSSYAYVITDENNIIIGLPAGNSNDFDGASVGTCRVWGLSYTGAITAMAGDDAAAVQLTDGCFELSSNWITIVRDSGAVSVNDLPDFSGNVTMFPNPATTEMTIDFSQISTAPESVEIYDAYGRLVSQEVVNNINNRMVVSLTNYAEGIYFVKLYFANGVATKRLIKAE